jgi:hypothetical protein
MLSIWTSILYSGIASNKVAIMSQNLPNLVRGFWLATLLVGLACGAVYLLVRGKIKPTTFAVSIGVLLIFDLWRVDFKFIRDFDYHSYFRKDSAIEFLQKDKEEFRVLSLPGTFQGQDLPAFFDVMQVFGYHGNQLKTYDDFTDRTYRESARTQEEYGQRYAQFLFGIKPDLLNVKYVLSSGSLNHPKFEQVFQGDGVFVSRNQGYLPRARIVSRYEVMTDRQAILTRIVDPDFDYRHTIILEENPPEFSGATDSLEVVGSAFVQEDKINTQVVKAELSQPGFLVMSENYYPSWKAYVDGKEAKIYRTDYLFRAVYLDQGSHQVKFVFDSATYRIGKASTLLTCALLLVMFIFYMARRAKPARPPGHETA